MRGPFIGGCVILLLAGCQAAAGRLRSLGPLENEGEVYLYLQPFPQGAERLSFSIESVSAASADGTIAPLELGLSSLSSAEVKGQRLLAWGRLAPGAYTGLLLKVKRAALETDGARADLLVAAEAARISLPFAIAKRRAMVLSLSLDYERSISKGFAFEPAFSATTSTLTFAQLVGYCSNSGADNVTVFDKRARRVVGVLPTGRGPAGVAIEPGRNRAYVALSGDDQVEVFDVQSGEELGRIVLRPGDRPRSLALTPDGRLLLVLNPGSNTASFVEVGSSTEIARVPTGEDPAFLLMDRAGRRAYVFNRRSSSLTVIDVANHIVAATVRTEPEPVGGGLNRAGNRLYVAQAGSAYVGVLTLPDLSVAGRIFVGLGASALQVDPRTDLIYVAQRDRDQLQVFDSLSFVPMSRLDVPDTVTYTVIDDLENVMFSLVPERRSVVAVDLVSGRTLASLDVGLEPYQVSVIGERR